MSALFFFRQVSYIHHPMMLPMFVQLNEIALKKDQVEKIGNTIIYLTERVPHLDRTKILHALFLLEQATWKKQQNPFFFINFQLWRIGPVAKEIYIDLAEATPFLLSPYIKKSDLNPSGFTAIKEFNDDQFSEHELALLKTVTEFVAASDTGTLIRINTSSNSLWYHTALQYGVLQLFTEGRLNSTDIVVLPF
jgi:uncharacterized phage-associated protein